MPVTIIKKNNKPPLPDPDAPVVKKAPDDGRPKLSKVKKIGEELILPDIDLHDEQGKVKFLVHLRKEGIWYRIKSYDEEGKMVRLISSHGTVFDSKANAMVSRNYMVVTAPEDVGKPSPEVIKAVLALTPP